MRSIKGSRSVASIFSMAMLTAGAVFVVLPNAARAQLNRTGGGEAAVSVNRPSFSGSANLPEPDLTKLFSEFGMVPADFGAGHKTGNSVGFVIYDRAKDSIVKSHNLDKSFNLASTTKLFTMSVVGQTFRQDPILVQHRAELADILRHSLNRGASLWLLLARDRAIGHPVNYSAQVKRVTGNCHAEPLRGSSQRAAELVAATAFFTDHRAKYDIDWTGAQIVDGAGCERAGSWVPHEDRMTPRQYLTVLDALRQQDFGSWNAFELMPQMSRDGRVLDHNLALPAALQQGMIAWKTGTDANGIKNIAGFISANNDPFAFYFVMFINSGKSPPESGLVHGKAVTSNFAAWAAKIARRQLPVD